MDRASSSPGESRSLFTSLALWLGALGLGLGVVGGCNKDTQAAAELPPTAAQPSPKPAAAQAAPEPGQQGAQGPAAAGSEAQALAAKISEANFELELKPAGDYAAGKPGAVELVLLAKSGFKVNEEYPYKFKVQPAGGVKFPSDVVKKDAIKLEKTKAVMTIGFTPESAGTKLIAGQFSFSVCTDERCLIEKRDLALNVDVK